MMDDEFIAVLNSLKVHWEGLKVFVDHPHIPMHNSEAKRRIRGPALGRKNYYGSGSIWSAELTSSLFSIFQTLLKWNINPRIWLLEYLSACVHAGGVPPKEASSFFPWKMSEGQQNSGGQPRHMGHTLKRVEEPDHTEVQRVEECECCHRSLTDHEPACGHLNKAAFPEGVNAPVQYGPHVRAAAVYLNNYQFLPYERTCELLDDLLACPMSEGTLANIIAECHERLEDPVARIKEPIP